MHRAVFIDRDGTLNISREYYTYKTEDFELYPNVVEGMALLAKTDLRLIVISNQAGIGKGCFTEEEVSRFNAFLKGFLKERRARIDAFYICPHTPDDNCDCRKPKTGLFERAGKDYGLDLARSFMIGDKGSDIEAGQRAGCCNVLVKTGYEGEEPGSPLLDGRIAPDYTAHDFLDAAGWIMQSVDNPGWIDA